MVRVSGAMAAVADPVVPPKARKKKRTSRSAVSE